jgi:hypothetical protein
MIAPRDPQSNPLPSASPGRPLAGQPIGLPRLTPAGSPGLPQRGLARGLAPRLAPGRPRGLPRGLPPEPSSSLLIGRHPGRQAGLPCLLAGLLPGGLLSGRCTGPCSTPLVSRLVEGPSVRLIGWSCWRWSGRAAGLGCVRPVALRARGLRAGSAASAGREGGRDCGRGPRRC